MSRIKIKIKHGITAVAIAAIIATTGMGAETAVSEPPRAEAHSTGFFWTWEEGWYGNYILCLRSGAHPHPILLCQGW